MPPGADARAQRAVRARRSLVATRRKKVNEAMHWLFTDEATAHGGLGEYEMRKKGLVPTGRHKRVCWLHVARCGRTS